MKKLILTISMLLLGCNSTPNSYIINAKSAIGLNKDNPVYINGIIVGKVHDFELASNYSVNIKVNLFPHIQIPKGSSAQISRNNAIISNLIVVILPTQNKEFILPNDTIPAIISENVNSQKDIKELLEDVFQLKKQDSLLQELKKLNKSLTPTELKP